MFICLIVITVSLILLKKYKPPLQKVLTVCCAVCIVSELIKIFGAMMLVPASNGKTMYLYMSMADLPFHFCTLQIVFIFLVRFMKDLKLRETILAFMYPTCIAGAVFAIVLTTTFKESVPVDQAFIHPTAYQFFLYHCMLVILGVYIVMSGEVKIKPKHFFSTLGILLGLAVASLYLNSMFASPVYKNGKLKTVEYTPNFFFTYRTPIGIKLTEMWHWYVYLAILLGLVLILLAAFYLPFFIAERNNKKQKISKY
ncbi:MAG: YwaF family protein [Clostridia bacterium]|nr:YwaF family protein [Clostridia bacterium]